MFSGCLGYACVYLAFLFVLLYLVPAQGTNVQCNTMEITNTQSIENRDLIMKRTNEEIMNIHIIKTLFDRNK